jgi:hypothetical protein
LATRDRHAFYARYGFAALAEPELFMELCPQRPAPTRSQA